MYAAIYIPSFPLQAILRLQEEVRAKPFAVIDSENRVVHMTAAARQEHVELGMTPTQAMARCSRIILRSRSNAQEESAQTALIQTAAGFSPFLEATAPGVITINLRGLSEFQEGSSEAAQQSWARRVIERVAQLQMRAQIGIAYDPDVAFLAAAHADAIQFVGDLDAFLVTVPLESAGLPPHILEIVRRWGLRNVGELRALGPDQLAARFGREIVAFLDRLTPARPRPLNWVTPAPEFVESIELEKEIEALEPLLFILRRFLDQLAHRLDSVHLVAGELKLKLALAAGDPHMRALTVPAPTRDVTTLFRMLHTHLENLRTEAPIIAVELRAEPARAEQHQFGLFEASLRDPNQFFETIARLEALLGNDRVGSPCNQPSHKPDDFRIEPPRFHDSAELTASTTPQRVTMGLSLRRFRPPLPAEVTVEDERPTHLQSKGAKGKIVHASGPWRLSGDWWEPNNAWSREEWDIRLQNGQSCRLFRADDGWRLDGLFD